MAKGHFIHTGLLARFVLRLDRLRVAIWLLSIAAVTWLTASSFTGLYSSSEERQAIAETMLNPAMTAMVGPGFGLENYTFGAMMAHQMLLMTAVVVGIMSIMLVTRHTRATEEDGRIEMIRSLPLGRLAPLQATLLVHMTVQLLLGLVVALGLFAMQIESMDLQGSLLYGAALSATGIFFVALTALFAQLSESGRGTIGLSIAALLLAYLIRAIGDVGNEWLSWLSPLGWIVRSEVYVENNWWPILLTFGIAILIVIYALYLNARRDLEAGFLPAKPGRKHASASLLSPFGLLLRVQRTGMIAWAVGMLVLGASYGSVLGDLDSFFESNEMMKEMLTPMNGVTLTEQFITLLMVVMAIIGSIPALMAMLKLIGEERKQRTEHLLARAVSRSRLIVSGWLLAVLVSLVMLSLAAIGLWAAGPAHMEEGISLGTIYSAALTYLPAVWIMIGTAILLIGIAPKWTSLIWLYLLFSFFVVYLGGLLQFPAWLNNLSPYGHISQLPVEELDLWKTLILVILAALLGSLGLLGYRRRDLQG